MGAIGVGACYLAENIDTVTVLWGATFGLGFGLGSILLPVSINQYFDKHRAIASGISFSGACLGSFVLPPVVEILLNTYGLSGTYLLLSGFILNCIPVALLLRKPIFNINAKTYQCKKIRRRSIISGKNVRINTVQNDSQRLQTIPKDDTEISIVHEFKDKDGSGSNLELAFDEKLERFYTQTIFPDYSIRMSISKPLDVEQKLRNSEGRKTVDSNLHEEEIPGLSSGNTNDNVSPKGKEVFGYCRSYSVQYVKPAYTASRKRSLSSERVASRKDTSICSKERAYLNYGFNEEVYQVNLKNELEIHQNTIPSKFARCSNRAPSQVSAASLTNYSFPKNCDILKFFPNKKYDPSNSATSFPKSVKESHLVDLKTKNEVITTPQVKGFSPTEKHASFGSFSVLFNPMFNLITITNAIYCFTFVCMITIVVDFARDLHIGQGKEKYVIMSLSAGGLIGRLGLGWITDRGFMTTIRFAALCFVCQSVTTAAVAWSNGFPFLILNVTLYGLSEAGIMVIYPVIISQYIDYDKQTVAVSSSNFLSGPLCLAVAPMIGYFRDEIGSYDYIFYVLAIMSSACSLCLLLTPYVTECHTQSRCLAK